MTKQLVLFDGTDSAGDQGLWVTNGIAAGTSELISGVTPSDLALFNSEVLFADDVSGNFGLWVTNGTAAGTSELTGITGANTTNAGFDPVSLTILNGEVLFNGTDGAGDQGLWVTNGTAAGTQEITGITGAYIGGLDPGDLTTFNGTVVFNGFDTIRNYGLWVSNGTAGGTHELTGISGAYAVSGLFEGSGEIIADPDFTVFNSEVLFTGYDASDNVGLWVTNGTSGGTSEVTGIGAGFVSVNGPDGPIVDPDFTVFNGEVLFAATNGPSQTGGLWVTNGTTAGTSELGGANNSGISGAYTQGLLYNAISGAIDPDFTIFNGEVLFEGFDADSRYGLWVTNGTAAGTSEVGGLGNTGISGAYTGGLSPTNFTVSDGEVLFEGKDAAGNEGLWVTNGTAAGTHELTGISGASTSGIGPSGLTPFTLPSKLAAPDDFTGSGTSDILFRADATGDTGFYEMVNGVNTGWHDIGSSSTAYSLVGAGDFTGNGIDDVLYRDNTTGDNGFYAIVNGAYGGWQDLGPTNTSYSVVGVGDFTGNGTDDILYRNSSTGDTGFYEMVNGVNTGWHDIGSSSTAYSVVGVGDFTGSGTDDILFRDNSTGDTGFYEIANGAFTGWVDIGASSTAYSVVGVGDFTGSGTDDILYRDNTTGDTGFYQIVNGVNTGWVDIGPSSTAYSVVGTGDYTGSGTDDILYRDNTTGDTGFYQIVNGANTGWHDLGASSTAYHVVS
jgi:ELWxxDGT repeat protein